MASDLKLVLITAIGTVAGVFLLRIFFASGTTRKGGGGGAVPPPKHLSNQRVPGGQARAANPALGG